MQKIKILLLILLLSSLFVSYLKSAEWEPVPYNFNYEFQTWMQTMFVADSTNAYVALRIFGTHGQIQDAKYVTSLRHSIDGGETWPEIFYYEDIIPHYNIPHDLQVPYPNHIFLRTIRDPIYNTLSNSRIRRSRDNGLTWDSLVIFNEYVSNGNITALTMYDTLVGAVYSVFDVSNEGRDYKAGILPIYTEDGWQTSKILRPDTFFNEYISTRSFHFFSQKHFGFYSAGFGFDMPHIMPHISGRFIWTEDGGETWERSNPLDSIEGVLTATNKRPSYLRLYFFNDTLGWMVGSRDLETIQMNSSDVIIKTTDGGRTWKLNYLQANAPMFGLQDIACKDEMNCIAVGGTGKVLRTTDGGETWTQEYGDVGNGPAQMWILRQQLRVAYLGTKPIIGSSQNDPIFWREKNTSILEPLLISLSLQVFPNPTEAHTTVTVDLATAGNLTVTLNNLLGQELFEIHNDFADAGEFSRTFSLKELPIGVYYLKISHNGNVKVEKVIRN